MHTKLRLLNDRIRASLILICTARSWCSPSLVQSTLQTSNLQFRCNVVNTNGGLYSLYNNNSSNPGLHSCNTAMMMGNKQHSPAVAMAAIITIFSLRQYSAQAAYPLKEEITHLQFYFHDRISGKNVTAVEVASAPMTKTSPTVFGKVFVMDDPLTEGPEPNSKMVGRAQGLYVSVSQEEVHLLMAVTYVFQDGEFSGSTLAVVGNNAVFSKVREMSIVGGSGKFRLARGYALAQTHSFDSKSGNAIVHYNVTVLHY